MFGNTDAICTGVFLIPGTELLPLGVLAVAYFITLSWLFLGISIIAEMFMAGIEKITSVTRKVKTGDGPEDYKMVLVWNPTVANLSLMALGSSAPEILLSVIEAVSTLGECPGELGPSTIVGSAAFNLLVISGLSILAVTEENDTDPRRDQSLPVGLKKINDMGVFSITSTTSIAVYLWLWYVLMDQNVELWEAGVTFGSFIVLLIACYFADRYKAKKDAAKNEPELELYKYNAVDFYKTLIEEKNKGGEVDTEKAKEMKAYLKDNFGTDQIDKVSKDELKKKVEGEGMLARAKYRRQVQNAFTGKRPAIAKGEIVRQEHEHAEFLDESTKNRLFGFNCLHYSVSEASG